MIAAIPKDGRCQYEGCDRPATAIACGRSDGAVEHGRHPKPGIYCDAHAEMVSDEGCPEYTDTCPNCGCVHGVN